MFRRAIERNNLEPSCLSMNCDMMIHRTRPMTLDESYEYHKAQIETAAKLGLPVAKTQVMVGPQLMVRLAPLAEKLGVKVGVEVHTPEAADSPNVIAFREVYDKIGSPYLGFVPDFGASVASVPQCFIDSFREMGIREEFIQIALEAWASRGVVRREDRPLPAGRAGGRRDRRRHRRHVHDLRHAGPPGAEEVARDHAPGASTSTPSSTTRTNRPSQSRNSYLCSGITATMATWRRNGKGTPSPTTTPPSS